MLNRALLRWSRRRGPSDGAPPEDAPPGADQPPADGGPLSDVSAPLVTRDEAARALRFFARAGVGAVVIDATPGDGAAPECAAADGTALLLGQATALPHATAGGAPCRCRYRAAPPGTAALLARSAGEAPGPADAVWIDD